MTSPDQPGRLSSSSIGHDEHAGEGRAPVFHGYLCEGVGGGENVFDWSAPKRIFESSALARPGYDETIAAHEYEDSDEVLRDKAFLLLGMLTHAATQGKNCVAYTGAGISTSAGVDDYASGEGSSALDTCPKQLQGWPSASQDVNKMKSFYLAQPTFCHEVLAACYRKGLLHYWVQQNHDGLPQKAGVPQCALNEIHGSWYDCSNPVVPMSGQLRSDLFRDFEECREKADIVLAFGTSLAGMNADSLCQATALRCIQQDADEIAQQAGRPDSGETSAQREDGDTTEASKEALLDHRMRFGGLVICSLQKTSYDKLAALRIFAKLDRLGEMIVEVESRLRTRKMASSFTPPVDDCTQSLASMLESGCFSETIRAEVDDVDPVTGKEMAVETERIVYPPRILSEPHLAQRNLEEDVFLIPYDAETGRRFSELDHVLGTIGGALFEELQAEQHQPSSSTKMTVMRRGSQRARDVLARAVAALDPAKLTKLDLREDASVRLCIGPHIGDDGEVVGKQREGHYKIRFKHALKPGAKLKAPFERILGTWWIEALMKGEVEVAPILNVS
ncbi:unnamed protein product [Amoebophrya sp. A25]|nr:unnamed protein product [Amoebophrya sp. A25]|eukprot:GSA25T00024691001.1